MTNQPFNQIIIEKDIRNFERILRSILISLRISGLSWDEIALKITESYNRIQDELQNKTETDLMKIVIKDFVNEGRFIDEK